uniref:BTB domain-containing protein n=1 Tax=Leersia perrieri TaxID=77586 RepID=A0A0D9X9X6_9ORYZ
MMTISSSFVKFKLDVTHNYAVGEGFTKHVSDGEQQWMIRCYPRGFWEDDDGEYITLGVGLLAKSNSHKFIVHAYLMTKDGGASVASIRSTNRTYPIKKSSNFYGYGVLLRHFVKRADLESMYVIDGMATIVCGIVIFANGEIEPGPIPVPHSNLGEQLGVMVGCDDSSDVSFSVDGEIFHAHRAVFAARSPVFKAELLGSMAEATMSCITIHDIDRMTFRAMRHFIYTDMLPTWDESSSSTEQFQKLFVAADRYALDRLKLMCAQKLWENMSVQMVATTLGYADMYHCPELKSRCLDFLMAESNFRKVAVTDGYLELKQDFPSVMEEIKKRIET